MPIAQVTFDFTGSRPNDFSMSFVQRGVSLTVSSALYDGEFLHSGLPYEFSTPTLSMTADGIGALNTYGDLETCFDADGKYEMATFAFGQTVHLVSVKLIPIGNRYNPTGVDTHFVMFGQGLIRDDLSPQIIDATDFTNEVSQTGDFLGIGARYYVDGFRIASITVEADVPSDPPLTTTADAFAIKSTNAPLVLDVLANDANVQLISGINTTGALGSVTLAADGHTLTYDAGLAFDYLAKGATATDVFTYTVLGQDGTSQTQSVTMTVTGAPNEITGDIGSNTLTGSERHDVILGLAGNDTINGMGGNDEIDGGTGKDLLHGNDGHDYINAGDGDDYAYGDAGNDTVIGGAGNDRLYGGEGNDSLDGTIGSDRMYGDGGNDVLTGGDSANILDGGTGVDTMTGGGGSDTYYVDNAGDKVIELASAGTDMVNTTINYTLTANVENLTLQGLDAISGTGNELANRLTGNDGNNGLFGLAGNDRLDGGLGNDHLVGGAGRDIVTGGAGADEFVFGEFGITNYDTVTDFNAVDDSIFLAGSAFGHAAGAIAASEFAFATTSNSGSMIYATTAAQHFIYDKVHGDLYYDADGNGAGAKQLIAAFVDGTDLTIADLFVF